MQFFRQTAWSLRTLIDKLIRKFQSSLKGKFTIILLPIDNKNVKQYHFPAACGLILKAAVGLMLCLSVALIAHTFYLSYYIKSHQAEFNRVDYLQTKLQVAQAEIEKLSQKHAAITAAKAPLIASFETQAIAVLKTQASTFTTLSLSRGEDPSGRSLEEIAAQDDLSLADHEKLLRMIYETAANNANQLAHIPSILPLKGYTQVTSPYGYRKNPFGGRSTEFHDGVDFSASYGTPVYATADGIVSFSGWDYGYGRKVMINHGNGIITFYGHNSKLVVSSGERVKKGDLIAYSGNSGRSSGPHLHYGAYINGSSVNPLSFTNK